MPSARVSSVYSSARICRAAKWNAKGGIDREQVCKMSLFGSSVRESIVFEAVVNHLFNRQSIINLYIDTGPYR
jgi:hypothetical protein